MPSLSRAGEIAAQSGAIYRGVAGGASARDPVDHGGSRVSPLSKTSASDSSVAGFPGGGSGWGAFGAAGFGAGRATEQAARADHAQDLCGVAGGLRIAFESGRLVAGAGAAGGQTGTGL